MAEIYAHKWTRAYGESAVDLAKGELTEAARTWAMGLAGVTVKQFNAGLELCVTTGEEWPPSLPKFREMCVGESTKDDWRQQKSAMRAPERRRDRLLSSDERNAQRAKLSGRIQALKANIK